jgi:ABC-2 type transport system permease protein
MGGSAVRGEWTKLRTEPGVLGATVTAAALVAAVGLLAAVQADVPTCPPEEPGCALPTVDLVRLGLSGVHIGQVAVVALAVLAVTDEYATGLISTTLIAVPRRLAVLAAKASVVVVAAVTGGTLGVLGAIAAARWALPGRGFTATSGYAGVSLADTLTLRAAGGSVVYLGLIALLGLGVGLAVRDTVAALTLVLGLLYAVPVLAQVSDEAWLRRFAERYVPYPAGLSVQATEGLDTLAVGAGAGLGVVAAWTGAALLLGAVLFTVRDA